MLRALVLVALAALPARAQEAREPVDLELVLLADATGSIDDVEIRLQRQGYADAMLDPEVLWAIANGGAEGRIAVVYVEWANASSQDVVVDWMVVEDAATARALRLCRSIRTASVLMPRSVNQQSRGPGTAPAAFWWNLSVS